MSQILFVDDEPFLLEGIARKLRREQDWDLAFATSAENALKHLAQQHVDVVVTDMCMPGMDGVQLLTAVRTQHPDVVRVMLTGFASPSESLRAAGVAHQSLSKPCNAHSLISAIRRVQQLRDIPIPPAVRSVITQMESLPSQLGLYPQIVAATQDPDTTLSGITRIVERDLALATKVVQFANSSHCSPGQPVSDLHRAISTIGTTTLNNLALITETTRAGHGSSLDHARCVALQDHSQHVAALAAVIAPHDAREAATTAGLFHDVGKLVLLARLPDQYGRLLDAAVAEETPLPELETEILGADHAQIGSYLLGVWGLPAIVVDAVAQHHRRLETVSDAIDVSAAVHTADAIVNQICSPQSCAGSRQIEASLRAHEQPGACVTQWRELAAHIVGTDTNNAQQPTSTR